MYMLTFVDFFKHFGFPDWLNYVFFVFGLIFISFLIGIFLFYICYKIYDFICSIIKVENLEKEVENLEKDVKKLKKGIKK